MQFTPRRLPRRPWMAAAVVACALTAGLDASPPQDSKSTVAARELAKLLDAAKLDSIAAPDPESPGVWIAALYFKDSQLLVVSAQYAAPTLLDTRLKAKEYRDIYIDLSSASVAGSKVFIQDQSGDGLSARPGNDGAADTVEMKDKTIAFDGDWRGAKMSEADYNKAFVDADERYARMLMLLSAQARPKSGS